MSMLLTHFEPLYTNKYHIGLSGGAVSRYTLTLKFMEQPLYMQPIKHDIIYVQQIYIFSMD